MTFRGPAGEFFQLEKISSPSALMQLEKIEDALSVLWFKQQNQAVTIDAEPYSFEENTLVFLTEFHRIALGEMSDICLLRFNRPFYCIKDHDSEVGCNGLLFFGAQQVPAVQLDKDNIRRFSMIWETMAMEIETKDGLQLEMLQTLLKRLLIISTRLFKASLNLENIPPVKMNLIREFCFLVEKHFRTKHRVAEYAELLFKSPKTISNVFHDMGYSSPLSYIHERIMIEARRFLRHTDRDISAIGYELGFNDIQSFSRFFKKNEGISPNMYRKKPKELLTTFE